MCWSCYLVAEDVSISGAQCAEMSSRRERNITCIEKSCMGPGQACPQCITHGTLFGNYFVVKGKGLCRDHLENGVEYRRINRHTPFRPDFLGEKSVARKNVLAKVSQGGKERSFFKLKTIEKIKKIGELLEKFNGDSSSVAKELSVVERTVQNYLPFWNLIEEIQQAFEKGEMPFQEAIAFAPLSKGEQARLFEKCKREGFSTVIPEIESLRKKRQQKRKLKIAKVDIAFIFRGLTCNTRKFSEAIVAARESYGLQAIANFHKTNIPWVLIQESLSKLKVVGGDDKFFRMLENGEVKAGELAAVAIASDQEAELKYILSRKKYTK